VVRFADALGYDGFPGLKRQLHRIVQDDLSGLDLFALHLRRQQSDVLGSLVQSEIENLSALWRDLPMDVVRRVAARILRARHVLVCGLRAESGLARYLWYHLSKIHPDALLIGDDLDGSLDRMSKRNSQDIVVAICFPRYARGTVEVAKFAKQTGMYVAAITDSPLSPLTRYSDIALYARPEVVSFVDSFSAPQVLLTALLVQVALHNPHSTRAHLSRFERLASRHRFFHAEGNHR
jgi:DNA-binding MurR/RpiR family transcriptional regulator